MFLNWDSLLLDPIDSTEAKRHWIMFGNNVDTVTGRPLLDHLNYIEYSVIKRKSGRVFYRGLVVLDDRSNALVRHWKFE